jgi:flavin reductase (DIM6/NTAB) family NADH-FMN oxidoreductase RutF
MESESFKRILRKNSLFFHTIGDTFILPRKKKTASRLDYSGGENRIFSFINKGNVMRKIDPREIQDNAVSLIGDDWMLVTAGTSEKFNTMTASWGGIGFMWKKPVAFVVIRPQRYTFEFIEKGDMLTLSFFSRQYRKALAICGETSGRNTNKVEKAGLSPVTTESGNVFFREARLVLECRKLYADFIKADAFVDQEIIPAWYPAADFHKMYVLEIVNAFIEE